MSKTPPTKTVSGHHFEPDPHIEALLRDRAESRTRYEMNNSLNTKREVERYEEAKRKAKK